MYFNMVFEVFSNIRKLSVELFHFSTTFHFNQTVIDFIGYFSISTVKC